MEPNYSDKCFSKSFSIKESHKDDISLLCSKYGMSESEIFRLGVDLINHFENQGELLRIIQKLI